MGDKARRRTAAEAVAEVFALPADAVAGLPLIELIGDRQVRIERHRGILAYDPAEIHVGGGRVGVLVRGRDMELKSMSRAELLITGQILGVELE